MSHRTGWSLELKWFLFCVAVIIGTGLLFSVGTWIYWHTDECVKTERRLVVYPAHSIKNCVTNCGSIDLNNPPQYIEIWIPETEGYENFCVAWQPRSREKK